MCVRVLVCSCCGGGGRAVTPREELGLVDSGPKEGPHLPRLRGAAWRRFRSPDQRLALRPKRGILQGSAGEQRGRARGCGLERGSFQERRRSLQACQGGSGRLTRRAGPPPSPPPASRFSAGSLKSSIPAGLRLRGTESQRDPRKRSPPSSWEPNAFETCTEVPFGSLSS